MRLLLLDNFDSFTFTLADYLRQLGAEVLVRQRNQQRANAFNAQLRQQVIELIK